VCLRQASVAVVAVTVAVSRAAAAIDVGRPLRRPGCGDSAGLEDETYDFRMDAALLWLTAGEFVDRMDSHAERLAPGHPPESVGKVSTWLRAGAGSVASRKGLLAAFF
jgi:hypothetical protein